jgi:prephenate dehydrogenase
MTIQITILGLGRIGASLGLALVDKKASILRVGNDREPEFARKAQKMGAVDQTNFNLPSAVRQADIVVLAMPVDEIKTTLETIAPDLKDGCVVMDTSPIKQGVEQWAAQLFPKGRHFVGLTPTINPAYLGEFSAGIDAAHADLFKNSLMIITSPHGADADALKLAADLAVLVGSNPFFADTQEIDGLLAAVHLLPELMAAALVGATVSQPGWKEARKVAGPVYAHVTQPMLNLTESKFFGQGALLNKENTLRMLDCAMNSLRDMRQAIADEDEEALAAQIRSAVEARVKWQAQREKADWDLGNTEPLPSSGEVLGRLIGLGKRKDKNK